MQKRYRKQRWSVWSLAGAAFIALHSGAAGSGHPPGHLPQLTSATSPVAARGRATVIILSRALTVRAGRAEATVTVVLSLPRQCPAGDRPLPCLLISYDAY